MTCTLLVYIVMRCPLPRWQMIWGCCRLFSPHHRIQLMRDLTMDKPINRRVYCNRHEQLPIPEHPSSLRIHREFVLFMCICNVLCLVGYYCHRQHLLIDTTTNKPPRCHSRSSTQSKPTPGSELWIATICN
jgi:hypothetical protein